MCAVRPPRPWGDGPAAARPEVLQALLECLRDEDGGCAMRPPGPGEMGEAAARPEVLQALLERPPG
jgi:hypothetical protein